MLFPHAIKLGGGFTPLLDRSGKLTIKEQKIYLFIKYIASDTKNKISNEGVQML